jgi:tetratricopeptide (TPR) repeat protein
MNIEHLSTNEIAQLLDGNVDKERSRAIYDHLHQCERCFKIFRDAAIHRGLWTSNPELYESSPELIKEGMNVVHRTVPGQSVSGHRKGSRQYVFNRKRVPAVAGAVAAAVVIFSWMALDFSGESGVDIPPGVLEPVKQAVGEATRRGLLVIPGGEHYLEKGEIVYRSGFVQASDTLNNAFDQLLTLYQNKPSAQTASWLVAGYIATWQIDAARDIIVNAQKNDIYNQIDGNIKPLMEHIDGNRRKAEKLYRKELSLNPDDPVAAINFAILLKSEGINREASSLLMRVIKTHPGTPMSARAQKLLESISTE